MEVRHCQNQYVAQWTKAKSQPDDGYAHNDGSPDPGVAGNFIIKCMTVIGPHVEHMPQLGKGKYQECQGEGMVLLQPGQVGGQLDTADH